MKKGKIHNRIPWYGVSSLIWWCRITAKLKPLELSSFAKINWRQYLIPIGYVTPNTWNNYRNGESYSISVFLIYLMVYSKVRWVFENEDYLIRSLIKWWCQSHWCSQCSIFTGGNQYGSQHAPWHLWLNKCIFPFPLLVKTNKSSFLHMAGITVCLYFLDLAYINSSVCNTVI